MAQLDTVRRFKLERGDSASGREYLRLLASGLDTLEFGHRYMTDPDGTEAHYAAREVAELADQPARAASSGT